MKKYVISLLSIALLMPAPLEAAPKISVGAKCTKVNQQRIQGERTFICFKTGNRLTWRLQAKLLSPKSPGDSQPVVVPVTPEVPRTPLEIMYQNIYTRYQQSTESKNPAFNFVRCPNIDLGMADATEKAYVDAYRFWSGIYSSNSKVNWLLMSEKDWQCWYQHTEIFEGSPSVSRGWNTWNSETQELGHCKVTSNAFCGYGTGVLPNGAIAQYNLIGSNYKTSPTPMTVHHETVHIYQSQLVSDNYQVSKMRTLPCWFNEGQANLFGVPIATGGVPFNHRKFEIGRLSNVYQGAKDYSATDWLKVMQGLRSNPEFCFKNELGYSLGWFALEWTYLNFSIEKMHNLLVLIAKGKTWEEAVPEIMDMSEETYLTKVSQYLSDII